MKLIALFFITAVAELVGCYLPYLVLREGRSAWLVAPAALSLALFAWLLTLHPGNAGRTYAAYGGVYVAVAMAWLWLVERQAPDRWDVGGSMLAIAGMALIVFGPRPLPIACVPSALSSAEHQRSKTLRDGLVTKVLSVDELDDGYRYHFATGTQADLEAWIELERRCCPFLSFDLDADALALTGPEGVKGFLRAELPVLLDTPGTRERR